MYTQHAHYVLLIFITGSKFQLVSNFTELHALTLATCSYALLLLEYSLIPALYVWISDIPSFDAGVFS